MLALAVLSLAVLGQNGVSSVSPVLREIKNLSSDWRVCVVNTNGMPGQDARWSPAQVPGFLRYNPRRGTHNAWFVRSLAIPADWKGRRIDLRLDAARYVPSVFIDGKLVGTRVDGWSPFEVDLTDHVIPGKTHQLQVRCQDYGGLFPAGFQWNEQSGSSGITGKVLAPYGGFKDQMGLIGPVSLRSYPPVRLLDGSIAISSSVRKGTLAVSGASSSPETTTKVEVWDGSKRVLVLPDGKGRRWLASSKANLTCWSPENPKLYQLRLSLKDKSDRIVDSLALPFGFREFWTDGPDFYLNGVKRHLLAASTWPVQAWLDPNTVRERLLAVKASGVDTFRLHIGPWQEEFTQIADQIGLMIVEESAVYTDEGAYAYTDPRFWQNYRDHLRGMVERDRNKPSVIMWSLGNEILFMGNERHDPLLPKKLGQLADYVKLLDKTRPLMFEADLDPDGKYDVIGLHYPHELPNVHAYPEAAFWLGSQKQTEAGGGMLGQKSSNFQWDRKKPLYIGEYLWVPVEDYSPGTVFFGDDAYLNRADMNQKARAKAWIDQTIAYRRSGVSGLCPWAVFDFGIAPGPPLYLDVQKVFYRRQTAMLRSKSLRFFSGQKAKLTFDVFNDTTLGSKFDLTVAIGKQVLAKQPVELEPGGYKEMALSVAIPESKAKTRFAIDVRLSAGGKLVESTRLNAAVYPRVGIENMGGRVWVYDPNRSWPNSQSSLPEPGRDVVLVIAPGALDSKPRSDGLPVVGSGTFDAPAFRRFLEKGGKVLVLEQRSLAALKLGLSVVDHASTMAYSIGPGHPILAGLNPGDLCHWQGGGYVSAKQLLRDGNQGVKAIVATGGPNGLSQTPISEMVAGSGRIVFVQMLVGSKKDIEPVAGILLNNAIRYLASAQKPTAVQASVISSGSELEKSLSPANLESKRNPTNLDGSNGLVLCGDVSDHQMIVREAIQKGLPIYWRNPSVGSFSKLRSVLGADSLEIVPDQNGTTLQDRSNPLLSGVSREDLLFTTEPLGWDKKISYLTSVAKQSVRLAKLPGPWVQKEAVDLRSAEGRAERWQGKQTVSLDRLGSIDLDIDSPAAGVRYLTFDTWGDIDYSGRPIAEIRLNGNSIAWHEASPGWSDWTMPVYIPKGNSTLTIHYANGPRWGGDRKLRLAKVAVSQIASFPNGFAELAGPGAVVTWKAGRSTVVVDNIDWPSVPDNGKREKRFMAALLQNLGFGFKMPDQDSADTIPVSAFKAYGGQYNTARESGIELRSTGYVEGKFACEKSGSYELRLRARSTPAIGQYATAEVHIDGRLVDSMSIDSLATKEFKFKAADLTQGVHTLRIAFPNDSSNEREDRNLFIDSVGFAAVD